MPVIRAALVDRGRLLANASIVHHDVEASQLAGGAIDERADGGLVADIGLDGDRPAPRLLGGVGAS